mgnify:CR=1 FL=1
MSTKEREELIQRIAELPEKTQNIIAGMVANELSHLKGGKAAAC